MLLQYVLILFPAGILAGIVGTVAGLASLVSYPALLAVGIPPIFANVTNTTALVFNGIGSTLASRRELKNRGRDLLRILPITVAGSIFGSILLLVAPASTFEHIVPFFIFGSAFPILFPRLVQIKGYSRSGGSGGKIKKFVMYAVFALIVFIVGAYTGYFGAAAGVVMIAFLTAANDASFSENSAIRNTSLGFCNFVAAVIFAFSAHVYWLAAVPLAFGFLIGGSIGPYIIRHSSPRILRIIIGIAAIGLAIYLFIQAYF